MQSLTQGHTALSGRKLDLCLPCTGSLGSEEGVALHSGPAASTWGPPSLSATPKQTLGLSSLFFSDVTFVFIRGAGRAWGSRGQSSIWRSATERGVSPPSCFLALMRQLHTCPRCSVLRAHLHFPQERGVGLVSGPQLVGPAFFLWALG